MPPPAVQPLRFSWTLMLAVAGPAVAVASVSSRA
jgi:hypothetical protein